MKLIFALGNPTTQYDGTRHNVGFFILNNFAEQSSVSFSEKSKCKANIAELTLAGQKVILAKPLTYYNDVGQSFRAIVDFYKISSEDTLIIHDELMLPFGTIRSRLGGSDAGNNGIKSLNNYGGRETYRLRIGVGNELREKIDDSDFVLSKFSALEREKLKEISAHALRRIDDFLNDSFTVTSHTIYQ